MSEWPPPPGSQPGSVVSAPRPRVALWVKVLVAVSVLLGLAVFALFAIRVPYTTIAPGAAVPLNDKVTVDGAESFPPEGEIELLFVRERTNVSLFRYFQAKLDPDIDLFRDKDLNPAGDTRREQRQEAAQEMTDAKNYATKVALEAAGYDVPQIDGVIVSVLLDDFPAEQVLQLGDVILTADGEKVERNSGLADIVSRHEPGEEVVLGILRDGERQTVRAGVKYEQKVDRLLMGVQVSPRFEFPIEVDVDTSNIGGPSAGLAISLAVTDELTPGNLTGGENVAVTGTIDPDGNVGPIGGIEQKAIAARAAGARVFLVPACPDGNTACEADIERASDRVGEDVLVVPVATFDDALVALRDAGGDAVAPVARDKRAA